MTTDAGHTPVTMTCWTCQRAYDYLDKRNPSLTRCPDRGECPLCGKSASDGRAHGDCIDTEAMLYDLSGAMPYDAMDADNRDLYWRAKAAQGEE